MNFITSDINHRHRVYLDPLLQYNNGGNSTLDAPKS